MTVLTASRVRRRRRAPLGAATPSSPGAGPESRSGEDNSAEGGSAEGLGAGHREGHNAEGAVTAELAVAFVAIGFVLSVAVGAVGVAVAQLQCIDSARAAARVAARGEADAAVQSAARQRGPAGAAVAVERSPRAVSVTVTSVVRLVAPLPALTVTATSVGATEGLG